MTHAAFPFGKKNNRGHLDGPPVTLIIAWIQWILPISTTREKRLGSRQAVFPLKYFSAPGWNGIGASAPQSGCRAKNFRLSLCTATMSAFFSTSVLTMGVGVLFAPLVAR